MIGVDSSIIIDILRNNQITIKKLSDLPSEELCTSEAVVYEVMFGIFAFNYMEERLKQFKALLDSFAYVFPIDRKSSLKSAEINGKLSASGKMIGHTDALIAGSLLANGCRKFVTGNAKDFKNIEGFEVISC